MNNSRRNFLRSSALLGTGLLAGKAVTAQHEQHGQHQPQAPKKETPQQKAAPAGSRPKTEKSPALAGNIPVVTPDITKLPWKMENGVKVFHLTAEVVKREFLPSGPMGPAKVVDAWGYNGSVPGPAIEVSEGDRVRIMFHNKLPEPTTVHWHGLEVPVNMDGVPFISQPLIEPGGMYTYEFTLHQHGTFFYHSHGAMQEMMGMIGLFIIHPKEPHQPRVDKDFGLILQEWAILPNNTVPNTMSMEFNWLTINGKAGPATTPMIVKQGERVRIRFVNLGMDHHPMHIHGNQFVVTGTEGGRIPESAWFPGNTVIVGVAQARDVEFDAKYTGDWMLHCHLPHHMMNQMASMVGPVAHGGSGIHTGMGMEEGMGMIRKGGALSEELGPGLGRGMGMTTREKPVSNLVGQQSSADQHEQHAAEAAQTVYTCPMHPEVRSDKPGKCPKCGMTLVPVEQVTKQVPGYPQDAHMLTMVMDKEVAKPETNGLAPGWSASMMGMMTLVRVLPPDKYEQVMAAIKEGRVEQPKSQQEHKHDEE